MSPMALLEHRRSNVAADKRYAVKEVYLTIQGEGHNAGRRAVFVRFAGCNLWSGRERTRPACAQWCDTDFVGTDGPNGGRYTARELAAVVRTVWADDRSVPFVVLTGGEPTLQWDLPLATATRGMERAVETNGTTGAALPGITWVTVSPKGAYPLVQRWGDELKLVYPQPEPEADPKVFEDRAGGAYGGVAFIESDRVAVAQAGDEDLLFDHYYLQPMEVPDREVWMANMQAAAAYVQEHPFWRLSLQTHKLIGLP